MIGKVTRGSDVAGLLRYLYGPGRANEHTNPHLVASWRGDDRPTLDELEPTAELGRRSVAPLADRLTLPLHLLPDVPDKHVWQCSMRLPDGDGRLTDSEWAQVAREVVETTGFATANDPGGCRWVAVRHAEDHIHIAVVLARQDGGRVDTFRDWPKVHAAARAVEQRLGLTVLPSPDRTASVAPLRAEFEKASRRGHREPARVWLAREVRVAVAGSASREEFEQMLARQRDVVVSWRYSQRTVGEVTGYRVGRRGDVDAQGAQIWFSGSKLSPDLSLPKLHARWAEVVGMPTSRHGGAMPADERAQAIQGALSSLGRLPDEPLHPGTAASAAEVASVLGRLIEGADGGPLTRAADDLARATRSPRGARAPMDRTVHDLRYAAVGLARLGALAPAEVGDALLLVAHLARIAHSLHRVQWPVVGGAVDFQASAARRARETLARSSAITREAPVHCDQVPPASAVRRTSSRRRRLR